MPIDLSKTDLEPDKMKSQRAALMAHAAVVKLKKMGLPPDLDEQLSLLSTDLAHLYNAQEELGVRIENFLKSDSDWQDLGDDLVDMRVIIDHLFGHASSIRRPLRRLAQYAYKNATT
mgnify:CR=1 FL=1